MKRKTILFIILAIIIGYVASPIIFQSFARIDNNKSLANMETTLLEELSLHEIQFVQVDSRISREAYFVLGDDRHPRLESCIYSTTVELNGELNDVSDQLSAFISNLNQEGNALYQLSMNERDNSITISKKESIRIGIDHYGQMKEGVLIMVPKIGLRTLRPIRFHDPRCRTMIYPNTQ